MTGTVLVLLVVLLFAGCAPNARSEEGPSFADLTVEPARTRPGGETALTLTNRSDHAIGYNLCPAVLDRRVDGQWQRHPEAPTEICTMELRTLDPNDSDTYRHTLPATLPAGTYRFAVGVEWPLGEERVELTTDPFEVTPG
jgi:hypothetical protein